MRIGWLFVGALGVVACGTTTTPTTTGPIGRTDLPKAVADAYCPTVDACCPGKNSNCNTDMQAWVNQVFADPSVAKQVYDADAARKCVDAIKALSKVECTTYFAASVPALAPCSAVFDGTLAPGATCTDVVECKRGGMNGTTGLGFVGCSEFDGAPPKRCREFKPATTVGTPCEVGFAGQSPTVSTCVAPVYCENGACAALVKQGASCANLKQCESDTFCVGDVCTPAPKLGEPCGIGCARGLVCVGGTCAKDPPQPWILSLGFRSSSYACR